MSGGGQEQPAVGQRPAGFVPWAVQVSYGFIPAAPTAGFIPWVESGGVACIPCGHTETYCNPGVEDMVCLRCFELYEYQEAGSCEGYYTNQGYYIGSEGAYGEGFYRRDLGRVVGGNLWKVERLHRLIVGAEE